MTTFAMASLIKVTLEGVDASSAPVDINVPGVKAGDIVLIVVQPNGANVTTYFSQVAASDDHITQKNLDFSSSGVTFEAVITRFV